jgi:hypothetical protein
MAMADQQAPREGAAPVSDSASGTSLLRMLLFGVLGLLVLALGYDYLWARKQHQEAVAVIESLIADPSAAQVVSEAEPITAERIETAINRQPTEKSDGATYELHRYSWRSGLPWRTHNIYVIYAKGKSAGGEEILFFHDFSYGAPPDPVQFPGPATTGTPLPDLNKIQAEHGASHPAGPSESPQAEPQPTPSADPAGPSTDTEEPQEGPDSSRASGSTQAVEDGSTE